MSYLDDARKMLTTPTNEEEINSNDIWGVIKDARQDLEMNGRSISGDFGNPSEVIDLMENVKTIGKSNSLWTEKEWEETYGHTFSKYMDEDVLINEGYGTQTMNADLTVSHAVKNVLTAMAITSKQYHSQYFKNIVSQDKTQDAFVLQIERKMYKDPTTHVLKDYEMDKAAGNLPSSYLKYDTEEVTFRYVADSANSNKVTIPNQTAQTRAKLGLPTGANNQPIGKFIAQYTNADASETKNVIVLDEESSFNFFTLGGIDRTHGEIENLRIKALYYVKDEVADEKYCFNLKESVSGITDANRTIIKYDLDATFQPNTYGNNIDNGFQNTMICAIRRTFAVKNSSDADTNKTITISFDFDAQSGEMIVSGSKDFNLHIKGVEFYAVQSANTGLNTKEPMQIEVLTSKKTVPYQQRELREISISKLVEYKEQLRGLNYIKKYVDQVSEEIAISRDEFMRQNVKSTFVKAKEESNKNNFRLSQVTIPYAKEVTLDVAKTPITTNMSGGVNSNQLALIYYDRILMQAINEAITTSRANVSGPHYWGVTMFNQDAEIFDTSTVSVETGQIASASEKKQTIVNGFGGKAMIVKHVGNNTNQEIKITVSDEPRFKKYENYISLVGLDKTLTTGLYVDHLMKPLENNNSNAIASQHSITYYIKDLIEHFSAVVFELKISNNDTATLNSMFSKAHSSQ